jgi:hypothetical protein
MCNNGSTRSDRGTVAEAPRGSAAFCGATCTESVHLTPEKPTTPPPQANWGRE